MAFDESELEVAQILLHLPRLIFDSEIRIMFPLAWGSKKQRTVRMFAPLMSSKKIRISFPNSKLRITRKRKRSENRQQNSSRFGGIKGRSCFCAVKDESSKTKKLSPSSNSSGAFLIPDLNLPLLIEEEENCLEHEAHQTTLRLSAC